MNWECRFKKIVEIEQTRPELANFQAFEEYLYKSHMVKIF
jgi:hypothetical protein